MRIYYIAYTFDIYRNIVYGVKREYCQQIEAEWRPYASVS